MKMMCDCNQGRLECNCRQATSQLSNCACGSPAQKVTPRMENDLWIGLVRCTRCPSFATGPWFKTREGADDMAIYEWEKMQDRRNSLRSTWPEDNGDGKAGESRIDQIARSHGDGEHYAQVAQGLHEVTSEMEAAAEKYWNDRRFSGLSNDARTWAGVYKVMVEQNRRITTCVNVCAGTSTEDLEIILDAGENLAVIRYRYLTMRRDAENKLLIAQKQITELEEEGAKLRLWNQALAVEPKLVNAQKECRELRRAAEVSAADANAAERKLFAAHHQVVDLLSDLKLAVETLRRYETLHRAKNTEESTEKAEVNASLASRFEATIASVEGGAQ